VQRFGHDADAAHVAETSSILELATLVQFSEIVAM
jgi:hypothetical protein